MWLKHAALVLFVVAGAAMAISRQIITLDDNESSPKMGVPLGSSLTFHCCLSINEGFRYRVVWHFNPSGPIFTKKHIKCEVTNVNSTRNPCEEPQMDLRKECCDKTWDLTNVTEMNAGWYRCQVIQEIPRMQINDSKPKQIVISKSLAESTTYLSLVTSKPVTPKSNALHVDWWIWILIGVSSLILMILLVVCAVLRLRARRHTAEEPIYINTHSSTNASPRPSLPVNKLKTVPSSQNLRAPSPGGRRYEESTRKQKY